MNNNLDAKLAELIASESFQNHCLRPTAASKQYWSNWQADNPNDIAVFKEAKKTVLQFALHLPEEEVATEFTRFKEGTKQTRPTSVVKMQPRRRILTYAAAVAMLLLSTFLLFQSQDSTEAIAWKNYKTEYGQTLTHQLPDGTHVTLNANSQLSVPTNWQESTPRQVKLTGEAFFQVKHTATDDKFSVQTEKGLITVLGTKFNVQEREGQLEVVLTEGAISLDVKDNPTLFLEPGQMAYVGDDNIVDLKTIDLVPFTAWRHHKMVFKNMPISRVVNRLKHDFGLQVIVKNEAISKRQITASIANDDPQVLLEALAAIYDLKITKQDSTTVIIE